MHTEFHAFLVWVTQHPHWAMGVVFLVAMAESLAVVGLVVPGAAIMVAAGALIALGAMDFWTTVFPAVAGAVTGDGISFWAGWRYRDRLRSLWPFRRHPEWLSRGEAFFQHHGRKSVLFGRFVGPVRPVIPVVAGMLGMRPAAFYGMNILSAFAWAPAYLLPGMTFGASLALAGAVAARLALLLVVLGISTWLVLWAIRWLFQVLSPRATSMAQAVLAWGDRHRRVRRIVRGLLDPSRPEFGTLLVMGMLLIGAAWLFVGVLEDVVTGDPLVRADQGLYRFVQGLRTPWGDRAMVFVTELGDGVVIAAVGGAVLAWLLWRRRWHAAGYWVTAIGLGQLAATMIKLVMQRPRPLPGLYQGLSTYAFPSGHATMSMVLYGFLAVLIARERPAAHRWRVYGLAALLVSAIAVSRLYLGAHWLSDVLGGLSLGLAWVALLAIAYYRHPAPHPLPRGLSGVALLALMLAGGWHVTNRYSADLQRYAPHLNVRHVDAGLWWQDDWRQLPTHRQDLAGEYEQPLDVQWSGALASLRETLRAKGWRKPVPLSPTTALRWLLPRSGLAELPMLPQVHDGREESLLLLGPPPVNRSPGRTGIDQNGPLVLRLWNSGVVLDPDAVPLWVGYVSFQEPMHILLLTLPVTAHQYDAPLDRFMQSLKGVESRVAQRPADAVKRETGWSGRVLLIRNQRGQRGQRD
jgi:membrane protein DedA with SNARE-associated domain/membrane-associated phospholipid phosphatase